MRRTARAVPALGAGGHTRRCVHGRILVSLAVALLAVLSIASPAGAGIFNVIPANSAEDPIDEIQDDDALLAFVRVDLAGGEVCVVDGDTELRFDNSLSCENQGAYWASSNQVSGIGTMLIPIQRPFLRVGTWKLLGDGGCLTLADDVCVTPSTDALSQPFTVVRCPPGACDPTIAQATLQHWKSWAGGTLGDAATAFCGLGDVWDKRPDVGGARKNYGAAKRSGDWVEDAIEDQTGDVGVARHLHSGAHAEKRVAL